MAAAHLINAADRQGTGTVVLLCMPWASPSRPSIALGILKRLCAEADVPARVLYPNMDIYPSVGLDVAHCFTSTRSLFGLSEHLFACDLFGAESLQSDEFLERLTESGLPAAVRDVELLRRLRDCLVPEFLERTLAMVLACRPRVVGFTATFNQLMPSLALAQRLKAAAPEVCVILGGAAVDAEMGLEIQRAFPETVDHVFLGEAEEAFRGFLRRLSTGEPERAVPGMTSAADGRVVFAPGSALRDLNQSPSPDYDDFYSERERVRLETGLHIEVDTLPFEGSRGCWWGAKNHCVFCGINAQLMSFREKEPARVVSEIESLSRRYQATKLMATDLIISRRHRREIFERIKDLDLDLECFYETRADLSKDEFELLVHAGIKSIQPGIESFSTELLKLMKKNTSRIRQIQFLRWCLEYQVDATYNILMGFPGDCASWYLDIAEFIPHIYHLQPPRSMHFAEMHRFSPLFELRDQLGIEEYVPREDYAHNFPPDLLDVRKVAYFFTYRSSRLTDPEEYLGPLKAAVSGWMKRHEHNSPQYRYSLGAGFVRVTDTRRGEHLAINLSGLHAEVFLRCDEVQTLRSLGRSMAEGGGRPIETSQLEATVEQLVSAGLLMREDDYLLALPVGSRPRSAGRLLAHLGSFEGAVLSARP